MNVKKVGLIGCGAIGTVLAEAIERKIVECRELVLYDVDPKKAQKLKNQQKPDYFQHRSPELQNMVFQFQQPLNL